MAKKKNGLSASRQNKVVHEPLPHDSAHKHVSGLAEYIDDIPEPTGILHGCVGLATIAHGTIKKLDLSAVRSSSGVVAVLTHADIPGVNDISPTGLHDEPVFAEKTIEFYGQPLFAVIAETRNQARVAATRATLVSKVLPHKVDVVDAEAANYPFVTKPLTLKLGDAGKALKKAPNKIAGEMRVGGQDHFYLEGHIAMAIPGEDDDVLIYSSTQHPSEVQHMVAHVLGCATNAVVVNTRRMGGGFGGKETQSNLYASIAAIAAKKLKRAVKIRPDRDDDMIATGKRHDFHCRYEVGFDQSGQITSLEADLAARCGFSADLSGPVTDRALFHVDNCYFLENVHLRSKPMKTNTVSNTAFRGFGGPQGMVMGERVIEEIAYALGKDPLEIRRRNFYGKSNRNITPYHQKVEDNIIHRLVDELEKTSQYQSRRKKILSFNKSSLILKKGIALTPVKFGISFTATWYNQAGALLHIYRDGSIQINHGGTEMGQGLNTKVAQIVADAFGLDFNTVKITATNTSKVPNTSATAASSGTDLNGMAALDAAVTLKKRLTKFACEHYSVKADDIIFDRGNVVIGTKSVPFETVINLAYMARVQLSTTGFYQTPKIHWDRDNGTGRPFYYFAYGASVSEVTIDTLTGEYHVDRTDILHDVGKSLNPAIDLGQVEGGFIQGMGWLTTEELWWDKTGRLRTHAPSTYKIPLASDRPPIFNVKLASWSENKERTIKRSKAVGEPPFMLAMSVLEALSMAVASVGNYKVCPKLDTPATPECVLMAVERVRSQSM